MPWVRRENQHRGGFFTKRAPMLLVVTGVALIALAAYAVYGLGPLSGSLFTTGDDPSEAKEAELTLGQPPYVSCPSLASGWFAFSPGFTGGIFVAGGDVDGDGCTEVIVGAGQGGGPHIKVFTGNGTLMASFFAFSRSFTGGVRVAAGDVDGDGRAEIIAGAGPGGGPHVKVFELNGTLIGSFFPFSKAFTGGVFVGSGDVRSNSRDDVIVGAGQGGGPHVRVLSGSGAPLDGGGFFAFNKAFTGGVRVAGAQVDTGKTEVVVGAGPGGGPHVVVVDPTSFAKKAEWFAFASGFTGGIYVGGGEVVTQTSSQEVIAGAGAGGGPHVRVFRGNGALVSSFFAYATGFTGGVRVGAGDADADGNGEVITGPGTGGGPHVKQFE